MALGGSSTYCRGLIELLQTDDIMQIKDDSDNVRGLIGPSHIY
jgi:hypothetical protein